MSFFLQATADVRYGCYRPWAEVDNITSKCKAVIRYCICQDHKVITVRSVNSSNFDSAITLRHDNSYYVPRAITFRKDNFSML
jgi:hypothetical protein